MAGGLRDFVGVTAKITGKRLDTRVCGMIDLVRHDFSSAIKAVTIQ